MFSSLFTVYFISLSSPPLPLSLLVRELTNHITEFEGTREETRRHAIRCRTPVSLDAVRVQHQHVKKKNSDNPTPSLGLSLDPVTRKTKEQRYAEKSTEECNRKAVSKELRRRAKLSSMLAIATPCTPREHLSTSPSPSLFPAHLVEILHVGLELLAQKVFRRSHLVKPHRDSFCGRPPAATTHRPSRPSSARRWS